MSAGPRRRGRPPSGGREAILAATETLLRERGIAHLTTREIAARAGVAEASIYYHYADRAGLLRAVLDAALQDLQALGASLATITGERAEVMRRFGSAVETFLERALPALGAAQADAELRTALAADMQARDLGLHRGVRALGGYLEREQRAGRVRADIDPAAAAFAFVSTCYGRVSMRLMALHEAPLPGLEAVVATLDTALAPERSGRAARSSRAGSTR